MWGKLYSAKAAAARYETETPDWWPKAYGGDTINVMACAEAACSFGVYAKILHSYTVSQKSVSHQWISGRTESDVILHEKTTDFLEKMSGRVSAQNRVFLASVYANAVSDTVGVIHNASLSKIDKLREYRRIIEQPITKESFSWERPDIARSRKNLLAATLCCPAIEDTAVADFRAVIESLAPNCAPAVTSENAPLLGLEPTLLEAVLNDNAETFLRGLLDLIRVHKHTKKFDLYVMVRALSADKPLLRGLDSKKFLRRYGEIYIAVWRGQYDEALDAMTGLLLDGEKADEVFLQLYLSLAAVQNQPEAFIFGKVRLAQYHIKHGAEDACRVVLAELEEMGIKENSEIETIRRLLGK